MIRSDVWQGRHVWELGERMQSLAISAMLRRR
ncbi:hypothetical protein BH24ACT22_BH24ACT22_06290 [soil metagenome]